MSLDLNDYFSLGLESTNQPIENAGMINVFRTPVDTSSANLNRVTFKFPKTGLLTADSMITLQFIRSDSSTATSDLTPNFVNGAIGAIKRTRILINNKSLVDIQIPGLAENVKLYSRNTQVELAERDYKLLGNQFRTFINDQGLESFDTKNTRCLQNSANNKVSIAKNIILQEVSSKVYGIPLRALGAEFLEAAALPVFLLGNREIVLEIEFFSDCQEYVCSPTGSAYNKGDVKVNLANCELVTTHIALPPDTEAKEIAAMQKQPVNYPLLDTYLIKGVVNTVATNVGSTKNESYRINFQNREVHTLQMSVVKPTPVNSRLMGNQFSTSMGDESLQMKVNGLNLFDRPLTVQPLLYQLTTYSEEGRTLKIPYNAWEASNNSINKTTQNTNALYLDYRGGFHYLKVDFSNANSGVFGSGTIMKTATEVEYNITPRTLTNPPQKATNDMLFYASISKLLSIGANQVNISY